MPLSMLGLKSELAPLGCKVDTTDHAGLPTQAKEAVAFALLAYETWHRRPGNVPAATGANRPAFLATSPMRNRVCDVLLFAACAAAASAVSACHQAQEAPGTVTMVIESSPTNLDPRIGTDGQSEHIDSLIFDSLVRRDEHFNIQPWLAQSWETPDPLTYIFHLRSGVRFQDGRPLTSKDVQWTIASILNGTVPSLKSQAYRRLSPASTRPTRSPPSFISKSPTPHCYRVSPMARSA
jgi:hypothetical protein